MKKYKKIIISVAIAQTVMITSYLCFIAFAHSNIKTSISSIKKSFDNEMIPNNYMIRCRDLSAKINYYYDNNLITFYDINNKKIKPQYAIKKDDNYYYIDIKPIDRKYNEGSLYEINFYKSNLDFSSIDIPSSITVDDDGHISYYYDKYGFIFLIKDGYLFQSFDTNTGCLCYDFRYLDIYSFLKERGATKDFYYDKSGGLEFKIDEIGCYFDPHTNFDNIALLLKKYKFRKDCFESYKGNKYFIYCKDYSYNTLLEEVMRGSLEVVFSIDEDNNNHYLGCYYCDTNNPKIELIDL